MQLNTPNTAQTIQSKMLEDIYTRYDGEAGDSEAMIQNPVHH